jgi:hypothetical protein
MIKYKRVQGYWKWYGDRRVWIRAHLTKLKKKVKNV